jgi:purine nucleoside phosphorylase
VTQGPRLETAAEIDRLERDGCTMVGMTAMPEAVLAREKGVAYAICALAVNRAAGRGGDSSIGAKIEATLASGMGKLAAVLRRLVPELVAGAL